MNSVGEAYYATIMDDDVDWEYQYPAGQADWTFNSVGGGADVNAPWNDGNEGAAWAGMGLYIVVNRQRRTKPAFRCLSACPCHPGGPAHPPGLRPSVLSLTPKVTNTANKFDALTPEDIDDNTEASARAPEPTPRCEHSETEIRGENEYVRTGQNGYHFTPPEAQNAVQHALIWPPSP